MGPGCDDDLALAEHVGVVGPGGVDEAADGAVGGVREVPAVVEVEEGEVFGSPGGGSRIAHGEWE